MIETAADATVPAPPNAVFGAAVDLEHAGWLPAIRGLHRVAGSPEGVGARYDVEVGVVGRHLHGVLVCRELDPPRRAVFVLEEGLDLAITVTVAPVAGGSHVEVRARYAMGATPFSAAVERASAGAARREVARAVEQLAAQLVRDPQPTRMAD